MPTYQSTIIQSSFGVDWREPIPDCDEFEQVKLNVPVINRPSTINEAAVENLQRMYPMERTFSSNYHAADLFAELVNHVTLPN